MTYGEVIAYLYERLPMFTRVGAAAYKSGLGNITWLCNFLGQPQSRYKTVHVAGTNGKGSTSHMLAAVLQASGYKTGLYTSPHLKDFRERVRVNGAMMPEQAVIDFVATHQQFFETIEPSFFELSTAMAFQHFADEHVDVAVIETGLGGRLDSTNIINPVLSIITNISWDHQALLGDTLEKIAVEKAGIIKSDTPVIVAETQPAVQRVFEQQAEHMHARLTFADQEYQFVKRRYDKGLQALTYLHNGNRLDVKSDLPGYYQAKNIGGVLAACDALRDLNFDITIDQQLDALQNVKSLTGLRGRWDILREQPLVIADVAHNEAGLSYAMEQLQSYNREGWHMVLGFVNDKDLKKILTLLPTAPRYYWCKPNIPRGLDANELQAQAEDHQLSGSTYPSVVSACNAALQNAKPNDLMYIGGSTFVVAEAPFDI